jgi:hypothetical protein
VTRLRQRGPGMTRCGAHLPATERPRAVGGDGGAGCWAAVGPKAGLG